MTVAPYRSRLIALAVLGLSAFTVDTASAQGSAQARPEANRASATPRLAGALRWADTVRVLADRATVRGDTSLLRIASALADRALQAFPNDGLLLHYRGYLAFRRGQLLMGLDHEREAKVHLDESLEYLERSLDVLPLAETHAVRSSAMGQLMGASMIAAIRYGSSSSEADAQARALGPGNPRVLLLQAVSTFYKPAAFGGSEERARALLQRAIAAFDQDAPPTGHPSWGKAEAWAWKGVMAKAAGNVGEARAAFERALAIEPEYGWVRTVLLPSLK